MKQIDNISEIHGILLGIAKEFHRICTENNIPYYMLGGTMLGAVRHQGFIPWDDDMDFGVPRQYYDRLLIILEKELRFPYRCCTYKNNPGVMTAFLKIDDCRTVADDPRVRLPLENKIGVNIDVFPLDYCKPGDKIAEKIQKIGLLHRTIYVGNSSRNKIKNTIKTVLSAIWPESHVSMIDRMHSELAKLEEGPMMANVLGMWKEKECIPIEWYGENVSYPFENTEFYGVKEYDKYLKQLYGDYMTPPNGDKHIHLDGVFWK